MTSYALLIPWISAYQRESTASISWGIIWVCFGSRCCEHHTYWFNSRESDLSELLKNTMWINNKAVQPSFNWRDLFYLPLRLHTHTHSQTSRSEWLPSLPSSPLHTHTFNITFPLNSYCYRLWHELLKLLLKKWFFYSFIYSSNLISHMLY